MLTGWFYPEEYMYDSDSGESFILSSYSPTITCEFVTYLLIEAKN